MVLARAWTLLPWILFIPDLAHVGACAEADCDHSCPISRFAVEVPKDRVNDVNAVTATGPCGPEPGYRSQPAVYFFVVSDVGVCHVTVSFQSGAPDFMTEVKIARNSGPCCVGQPTADTSVIEVPDGGPVDAAMDN